MRELEIDDPVKHVKRKLHSAIFKGMSASGKRAKVLHNAYGAAGYCLVHDYFKLENLRHLGEETEE